MYPQLAGIIGGWQLVLILAILLLLLPGRRLGDLVRGLGQGLNEFCKATREVTEEIRRAAGITSRDPADSPTAPIRLFVAQGFGVGRIPFAPGTFGSVVGVLWFALLVWTGHLGLYLTAAVEAIGFSVWLCDDAEIILHKKDPGSVVLDEIVAIPFCFLPWLLSEWFRLGHVMPPVETFFQGHALLCTFGVFALFRLFDIWKPWPISRLQDLPGGWGVTIDDLLAGVYVALITVPIVIYARC